MSFNDPIVGERRNRKRWLNLEEKQEGMKAKEKVVSAMGAVYSTVTRSGNASSSKQPPTTSSSSTAPPMSEEQVRKKMKLSLEQSMTETIAQITSRGALITVLGEEILRATRSKDEGLEKKLEKQKEDAKVELKGLQEQLAGIQKQIEQLSQPVALLGATTPADEVCKFFLCFHHTNN